MLNATEKSRKTICVMIGDVSFDFSAELVKGLFHAAAKEGVRLLLMMGMPRHAAHLDGENAETIAYHYNSIYDYASLSGAEAYVFSCGALSGFESENTYQQFLKRFEGTPYVILQENVETMAPHTSSITVDNESSFSQCIEHLIQVHGCHKIGFVGGLKDHPDTRERLNAYRHTMEKHGNCVTDAMIVNGDFSEYSDRQVAELLDRNPELDAIAFCNDEMAKGGYRECKRRGLKIGQDIAVTGFDNFSTSRSLIPPLTTISQNIYQMGELALRQAIALIMGKRVHPVKLKTDLHIRRSCGCYPDTVKTIFPCTTADCAVDMEGVLRRITEDLINAHPLSERIQCKAPIARLTQHLAELQREDMCRTDTRIALADWLRIYCEEHPSVTFMLADRINDYVLQMPTEYIAHAEMRNLFNLLSFVQGFLFSYKAQVAEHSLDEFRAQSWFIPELIRDLVAYDIEDEGVFLSVVERLHAIHLNNIYICLLPEPRLLRESEQLHIPEKLRLAAYMAEGTTQAYSLTQMPEIDAQNPLDNLPHLSDTTHLMCFSVFSGDVQYGIFICEMDICKSALMHIVGLQLGILINFLELKQKEKIVGNELENIRERNEILNFLSEYDQQCSILNRRGFIERAIRLNRENVGKHAICVFMDLDHLKEINDTFGHSQGDAALVAVSDIMRQTVRSNDLVARIGGDEFVGMFIVESPAYAGIFKTRLEKAFDDYNRTSGHPYYVEASVGIANFTCNLGLEISKIVNDADRYLYEEKKNKRDSALKPTP